MVNEYMGLGVSLKTKEFILLSFFITQSIKKDHGIKPSNLRF